MDREQRILKGTTRILYHQTNSTCAKEILKTKKMKCGQTGYAGGGIYFAVSREDTNHKATRAGVILQCRVRLGNIKRITSPDPSICFTQLQQEGYDSIEIGGRRGVEHVVYNSDQVDVLGPDIPASLSGYSGAQFV